MVKSIVVSCDTYYYQLANEMGIDLIAEHIGEFGFGSLTGIDVHGEAKGVLPSPAWKRARFKKPEQKKWYAGETISMGIGQGYNNYTTLQLAHATATLAAGGVMFKPHLVKYVEDARTGKRRFIEPTPIKNLEIKPEHFDVIKRAMVEVNKWGTGARAFANAGYVAAGKTGTSQVFSLKGSKYVAGELSSHLHDHALFVAFAPADKPTIALALIVENGGFGAVSAAPIARQVLDYYLLGKRPASAAKPDTEASEAHAHP